MVKKPFTLRKLLTKLPPGELEKFMDAPLKVEVRDPFDNVELVNIEDDYPIRREPAMTDPGQFALIAYPRSGLRKTA